MAANIMSTIQPKLGASVCNRDANCVCGNILSRYSSLLIDSSLINVIAFTCVSQRSRWLTKTRGRRLRADHDVFGQKAFPAQKC